MQAFCLLSSGMDSATVAWLAAKAIREANAPTSHLTTIFFRYGQRSEQIEEARAGVLAARLSQLLEGPRSHLVFSLHGILPLAASALTNPERDGDLVVSSRPGFPASVVEFRNGVFLSVAAAIASGAFPDIEAEPDVRIYAGMSAVDNSGYPDCREATILALQEAITQGTVRGVKGAPVRITVPLLHRTKEETVKLGLELGVPFDRT